MSKSEGVSCRLQTVGFFSQNRFKSFFKFWPASCKLHPLWVSFIKEIIAFNVYGNKNSLDASTSANDDCVNTTVYHYYILFDNNWGYKKRKRKNQWGSSKRKQKFKRKTVVTHKLIDVLNFFYSVVCFFWTKLKYSRHILVCFTRLLCWWQSLCFKV